jgi:hypothetical protein
LYIKRHLAEFCIFFEAASWYNGENYGDFGGKTAPDLIWLPWPTQPKYLRFNQYHLVFLVFIGTPKWVSSARRVSRC